MSLAVHSSLCEQKVSRVAKKGSGKVQSTKRTMHLEMLLFKKIMIFLGILFLESQKPSKGLSFYFIYSFIQRSTKVGLQKCLELNQGVGSCRIDNVG